MERPFDAVVLVTAKLKEEKKDEDIWERLRDLGKKAKLSPGELDSLFSAAMTLESIRWENVEKEAPTIIENYLNTTEGKGLNGLLNNLQH